MAVASDLTAWALRRRPASLVDEWDGTTHRRVLDQGGVVAAVEVRQVGPPAAALLDVAVTSDDPRPPAPAPSQASSPACSASTSAPATTSTANSG